jgi:hypothetical protein
LEEELNTELKEEKLSLDESKSDDEINILSASYDQLKNDSNSIKKKINEEELKKKKIMEFSPKLVHREEVVDDFIRNFFTKYNLTKTLDEFNV